MVELLLSKGADVNILSCCGTPLHVAAMENQGAVMKILLDNNADVSFFSFDVFGGSVGFVELNFICLYQPILMK
jgi:ankyrin repeat protein